MQLRNRYKDLPDANTIRMLVATDNHVGYAERDDKRGDDSWKTFHEVMCLAKEHSVDMVLLAGDLFHENKPSRKSLNNVMRSLRMNCYGEKPCELEMLSDPTENFEGAFDHVNYEDPDINVAIPVFSIHGNHDDPSGEGHLAALDLLQTCGLINYYGRTPESDNIQVKPVLLQKGGTKLALYGMSNVRDERLFRTFRDSQVKFFQPNQHKDEWYNIMSVHQNHNAHTDTGYLPENFLPEFLDLVIWGHEHECLIDPRYNPEMGFHVIQPGSSVATSLCPGEAVPKQVAILNVRGKEMQCTPIPLKTVRPFIMKEIVLYDQPGMKQLAKKEDNRGEITRYLEKIVHEMIAEAKSDWDDLHKDDEDEEDREFPLPLIRLRVEYSAPEGSHFNLENPQRFSNRFVDHVANVHDVVQFHKKKSSVRKTRDMAEMPEESVMAQLEIDSVRIEKLVREFLSAQSLTILPQNRFGDAVGQFVDKDDKHAMESFVSESLSDQIKHLLGFEDPEEVDLLEIMGENRSKLEELFAAGHLRSVRPKRVKPKPAHWDSDQDGNWDDQPAAIIVSDGELNEDREDFPVPNTATVRGRSRAATQLSTRGKKTGATGMSNRLILINDAADDDDDDDDDDDEDIIMLDHDEEGQKLPQRKRAAPRVHAQQGPPKQKKITKALKASSTQQTKLPFSQASAPPPKQPIRKQTVIDEISDDEVSDDAFEPMASTRSKTRK